MPASPRKVAASAPWATPIRVISASPRVIKRAEGVGRIQRVEGLQSLFAHYDEHIAHIDLVPVGQPRRDYRKVVEGDGWIVVRHPDLETTLEISDHVATDLRMYAG